MAAPVWITDFGRIATVEEGSALSVEIEFTSASTATVIALSGEIPDGTVIQKISNTLYRVQGTVSAIPTETEYFFTLRANNDDGESERGFSILVSQITPQWLALTRLDTVVELDSVEIQFQLDDPGGTATFTKIAGTLPPGVSLNDTGLLKGRVGEVDVDTVYTFTMRAVSSEGTVIDKVFEIEVQNATGNRSPIWLTSSGQIGIINNGETSPLVLNAFDPDGDVITYSITSGSLPTGLTLNTATGAIEGVCTATIQGNWPFNARISDGSNTRTRSFVIATNENFDASIDWVTDAGNIGTLSVGENSLLAIEATSSYPIRYSITLGALPDGLELHPSEATIYDDVRFQTPGEYTFTVLATNDFVQSSRQFSITITEGYEAQALRAYLQLPHQFISEYREIVSSTLIDWQTLFRPYDDRYGVHEHPKMMVYENMKYSLPVSFKASFENQFTPLEMIVGDLKFAYARDENGFVIYEVIYRDMAELVTDPLEEFISPQTQVTIKPAAINNFRLQFASSPGVSGPEENLPLWMTSEQINGDPDSVLGYIPAIPILFLKPGEGEQLYADLLDDEAFGNRVKGEKITYTQMRIEVSVDDDLPQDFSFRFHSLLETQEQQELLALNAPVWTTDPGSLGEFVDGDFVSVAVVAEDPNGLPRSYSLSSGDLPFGLSIASNGVISGTITTELSQYWSFIVSADSSSGYSRTRSFLIGTNIDS